MFHIAVSLIKKYVSLLVKVLKITRKRKLLWDFNNKIFFCILLLLLFMYVTYISELDKKITGFVRPIFNSNDSVISNYILDKKKFKSCIVEMTHSLIYS